MKFRATIASRYLAGCLAGCLALAAAPVLAATGGPGSSLTFSFVIAFLLTSSFLIFTIWALIGRGRALDRAREAEAASNFNALLLEQSPSAFLVIFADGTCYCSDRLREWLGLSHIVNTLDDLLAAGEGGGLAKREFDQLADAVGRLATNGRPFRLGVRAAGTERAMIAAGHRIDRAETGGPVDLVWFNDVSENAEDAERLRSELSALELKHAQLSDILDAAPFPVWIRDGNLGLQWVNAAYVAAVEGESVARVLKDQVELCSSTVAGSSKESAGRAIEALQTKSERQSVVTGGKRRTLEVIDVPLGGSGDGLVGFAIDVTDAEHTRSEFNLHKESQAETLNKLSAPVAIFASNTRLEFYNSAFAKLWRLSEDWLNDKPRHSELLEALRENRSLPEQTDFPAWKAKTLAYYTEILEPIEEMWHLPDDKTLRVVTQPHPMGGLLVIFEDVTDRLALESSYNTLIAVQRETIDNLHEAVVVVGSDLCVKLYNQNYAAIWGLDKDDLANEPHIGDVIDKCGHLLAEDADDREALKKEILGHSISRETSSGRWLLTNGKILEFATVPLPDGASLTTLSDVTATHRVELALRERNEALEAADRLKAAFIANMSYELRTPLNSILGFSEILENQYFGPLNEQQAEYVGGIILSSRQLRDLIDDILDLAVVEAGQVELDISKFDLAEAISAVVAIAQDQAHRKNIDIRMRLKKGLGSITGDKRRIKHAIYNIMQNAIAYTHAGGSITISADGDGQRVVLEVTDTGIGIAPAEQISIFDKFRRGSNIDQAPHGVGLGLALVRSFIEVHGGSVELESEPDQGTTVTITLPRTPATETSPATPPDDDDSGGNGSSHGQGVVSLDKRRRA